MRWVYGLAALLTIFLVAFALACGDDDDDDDGGDDDDADDDDDESPDYGEDPLAVLDCPGLCAELGESLAFEAGRSEDPEGGGLAFAYDFGDGSTGSGESTAHAFGEVGAYRVVLTATAESGRTDSTSCVVSVGDFPAGPGAIEDVSLRPNWFNPAIVEQIEQPEHGGTLFAAFVSPIDAEPDLVYINGAMGVAELGIVSWCEVVETELSAGEIGIVRCHSYSDTFDPGRTVTIEVADGPMSVWKTTAVIPAPTLAPTYITTTADRTRLFVHVRNDSWAPLTITGFAIDGVDVSNFAVVDDAVLAPGAMGLIRLVLCDGVPADGFHVYTIAGEDADGEPVSASRPMRLFAPAFPVGNWSSGDVFADDALRAREREVGIDMLIWSPEASGPRAPENAIPLAASEGFSLFLHHGDFEVGDAWYDTIAGWVDSDEIGANAVSGEGDLNGDELDAQRALAATRRHRALWPADKPLWIYNACSYKFPAWGAIADVGGMDHYCVWAPKCNINEPRFYWDRVEMAGYYAEAAGRAAEPKPTWNWTQGAFNVSDIETGEDSVLLRCTTPEEIRAQWYQVVEAGAKGLLWFIFRENWDADCPNASEMMRTLADELAQFKRYALEGDPRVPGTDVDSPSPLVDAHMIAHPEALVLIATNADYDLNLVKPYEWHEAYEVPVEFTPPEWFEPAEAWQVDGDDRFRLEMTELADGRYRVVLPKLAVAEAVVVEPEP